ncbi:MAG: DUF268 domain-containing protein [Anaeromyxobacter sp.]|nr:DUF268 domain-containing protein [Anaeromyxobacter sp.]
MTTALRRLHATFGTFGLDGLRLVRAVAGLPWFMRDAMRYRRSAAAGRLPLRWGGLRPMLADRFESAGVASGQYFHQDLWAARQVFSARPARHVDVGSRVDGFVAHLLTFMPVEVVDVRPLASGTTGLTFVQEDATELRRYADASLESVSSLHAVEHFGLGRYGDPVDPSACFRAMASLARVLRPGGRLYFSVPVGAERLEFNAHRIFDPATVLAEFSSLRLIGFSAVDDAGTLDVAASPDRYRSARYACGLFEFTKD